MKEKLILFIKGVILGVAFIIPGVSGGTLAVLLGIYEDLLEAAGNFYKGINNFKKYFMFLLPIGLGVVFSIGLCAKIIKYGLDKAPIVTILVFLGLIIGGLPKVIKGADKKPGVLECVLMLAAIGIIVGMMFIGNGGSVSFESMNAVSYILLFLVGMLASATMVIPGISGSATLMMIGYYEPILHVVEDLASFNNIWGNFVILLPFFIGIVIGIVLISKLIKYLLDKYYTQTYYVIIGFVLASVISVFSQVFNSEFIVSHFVIGMILMVIDGLFIYKIFDK